MFYFLFYAARVDPQPHDIPKPDGHIRMVCISDTHNRTDNLEVPPGDILVHAGDFSNVGLEGDVRRFKEFLAKLPHKHKVRGRSWLCPMCVGYLIRQYGVLLDPL